MGLGPRSMTSPSKDSLALAFRTQQSDATLFVVHSRTTDEFINVTLRASQPFVSYRVGREIHYVQDPKLYRGYNDNRRHILLFERLGPNCTLKVDSEPTFNYIAKWGKLVLLFQVSLFAFIVWP
ncbi:neurexin-1a-beta-like [Convolutriloba macropyga]|uniref:neurexin-1a-beta-like n=1 Tax=Convolutriloba macropyga TaxID=536237 RepID=UPI003F527D26